MRILLSTIFASAAMLATPALAWTENMTQPASDQIAIWAYPAQANYCPAGLQPVVVGGVICCGQPTHTGYQSHPTRRYSPSASMASGSGMVVNEKGQ